MAKTMARVEDGVVVNIEWYDDYANETDDLKFTEELPVNIGDTYSEGKFYREGKEVISYLNEAYNRISEFDAALVEIEKALNPEVATIEEPPVLRPVPTIEERKEAVLAIIQDMQNALQTLGVNI